MALLTDIRLKYLMMFLREYQHWAAPEQTRITFMSLTKGLFEGKDELSYEHKKMLERAGFKWP